MSESAGITLLLTQIQALTAFDSSNAVFCQWGVLNSGASASYAIIRPGPLERIAQTFSIKGSSYRTVIEVWQRYKDDGSTVTSLLTNCENIINRIDQYRKLADTTKTLQDANVTGMSEVTEQWRNNADGPSWLKRDIYIDWIEEDTITYAE